jgi:hypothetical protein
MTAQRLHGAGPPEPARGAVLRAGVLQLVEAAAAERLTKISASALRYLRFWDAMDAVTLEQLEETPTTLAAPSREPNAGDRRAALHPSNGGRSKARRMSNYLTDAQRKLYEIFGLNRWAPGR